MEKLGTRYGGWYLPKSIDLNQDSIIYSGGVGEDMSFDLKLQSKYDSHIILIDPTRKSVKHYEEIKQYYTIPNFSFTGNIQHDYVKIINDLRVKFDKFHYINKGLYSKKDTMNFYMQTNKDYVSQSLMSNMFGTEYYEVEVDTIKNIMQDLNHTKIDLLKLDIEGAEIEVLNNMLDDEIYPRYLCIEFDLLIKNKDTDKSTNKVIMRLLESGYNILINDKLNITFERKI